MKRKDRLYLRGLKMILAIYETTDKQYADADPLFEKIRENDIRDVKKLIAELEGLDENHNR